jgi:hypothetical protein
MSTNDFSDRSTGWVIRDGRRYFLTGSGMLGAGGLGPDALADLGQGNLRHYALPDPPPDLRLAISASLDFLALGDKFPGAVLLWAAMYAAPLCPLKTLDAVIWVHGPTGCGKSVVTHLALAHFGPGFVHGHSFYPVADWAATLASLEDTVYRTKDVPLVIDDCDSGDSSIVSSVVHQVISRSGRGHITADLSQHHNLYPRGLVITTGESLPVGLDVAKRTIGVLLRRGQVVNGANSALDQAQVHAEAGLYAQAMSGYVVWLVQNWDRLSDEVPQRLEQAHASGRSILRGARRVDHYATLVVADRLALEYAAATGALSQPDQGITLAQQHQQIIADVLK